MPQGERGDRMCQEEEAKLQFFWLWLLLSHSIAYCFAVLTELISPIGKSTLPFGGEDVPCIIFVLVLLVPVENSSLVGC
jgi:hypothetical protein